MNPTALQLMQQIHDRNSSINEVHTYRGAEITEQSLANIARWISEERAEALVIKYKQRKDKNHRYVMTKATMPKSKPVGVEAMWRSASELAAWTGWELFTLLHEIHSFDSTKDADTKVVELIVALKSKPYHKHKSVKTSQAKMPV